MRFLKPKSFVTVGKYLGRDVMVSWEGILLYARKQSEDIGYYGRTTKADTSRWFKPERNQVVVDCGVSVGIFSLIALRNGAEVYAFEPNPETFDVLRKNVEANGYTAHLFPLGLASKPETLTLYSPRRFTGTASFNGEWNKGNDDIVEKEVAVTTLDDQLSGIGTIQWLLIDVESFELELLMGADQTLKKTDRMIIEVSNVDRDSVLNLVSKYGFRELDHGSLEGVQYFFFDRA